MPRRRSVEEEVAPVTYKTTLVVSQSGDWCYRHSSRTGWPDVSTLQLSEIASVMCSLCQSVKHAELSRSVPETRLVCCWDVTHLLRLFAP